MYRSFLSALLFFSITTAQAAPFFKAEPTSDSRLIYLSESGSDANPCTQALPCRTLLYGLKQMRRGAPDHLYLERGGEWDLDDVSGRDVPSGSATSPAVLGYYGVSGDRPIVMTAGKAWDRLPMHNVVLMGWHFVGKDRNPHIDGYQPQRKVGFSLLYASDNFRIDDVKFSYLELVVQPVTYTGGPAVAKNFMINRSIFVGSHDNRSSYDRSAKASNLYITGIEGLKIEESVFDLGGWYPDAENAGATQFNHCVYGQYSNPGNLVEVRGNIFSRCSSHGLQVRWGGLVENNFFARNAVAATVGYHVTTAPISPKNTRFHFINNVITEMTSQYRGDNHCEGATLCSKASWGIDMEPLIAGEGADFVAKNNYVGGYNFAADGGEAAPYVYKQPVNNIAGVHYGNNIVDEQLPTLSDYAKRLGVNDDDAYSAFMGVVVNRPVGQWQAQYSAAAINDFVRSGGDIVEPVVTKPQPLPTSEQFIQNSTFAEKNIADMSSILVVSDEVTNEWFARVGDCNQCSQKIMDVSGELLRAGAGTTNGTMQIIPWPNASDVELTLNYQGSIAVELFGARKGDTINKYDNGHALDSLNTFKPASSESWQSITQTNISLEGDYDYLVVCLKGGKVNHVELSALSTTPVVTKPTAPEPVWLLEDMLSNFVVENEVFDVWFSRVGDCGQCSSLRFEDANQYLKAGGGTSNGAVMISRWLGNHAALSLAYRGDRASIRIYGANVGDTISKWNATNTMALLKDIPLESTLDWNVQELSLSLAGTFDYLVVQVYSGDFDRVTLGL